MSGTCGYSLAMPKASLTVVVPALNEAEYLPQCLNSLQQQAVDIRVFVSDNASEDETSAVARLVDSDLSLSVRRLDRRCGPTEHFVLAARWALESSDTEYFSFLAADDEWHPDFSTAVLTRFSKANVDIVLPSFEWKDGDLCRVIRPSNFLQRRPQHRQLLALMLPDWKELANLLYAVYTRAAFCTLIDALHRGEDEFAADYAAAWYVLGRYRAAGCEDAVGVRRVRANTDLLERVGMRSGDAVTMRARATAYTRLYCRVNGGISRALARLDGTHRVPEAVVFGLRLPQALLGIPRQLKIARLGRGAR